MSLLGKRYHAATLGPPEAPRHFHSAVRRDVLTVLNDGQTRMTIANWGYHFTQACLDDVCGALSDTRNRIETLRLWNNNIGISELTQLHHALLHQNCRVRQLELDGNRLDKDAIVVLARIVRGSLGRIETLGLSNTGVDGAGFIKILELFGSPGLITIELDDNLLIDEDIGHFAESLIALRIVGLHGISLRRNGISSLGLELLLDALRYAPSPPQVRFTFRSTLNRINQEYYVDQLNLTNTINRSNWLQILILILHVGLHVHPEHVDVGLNIGSMPIEMVRLVGLMLPIQYR